MPKNKRLNNTATQQGVPATEENPMEVVHASLDAGLSELKNNTENLVEAYGPKFEYHLSGQAAMDLLRQRLSRSVVAAMPKLVDTEALNARLAIVQEEYEQDMARADDAQAAFASFVEERRVLAAAPESVSALPAANDYEEAEVIEASDEVSEEGGEAE